MKNERHLVMGDFASEDFTSTCMSEPTDSLKPMVSLVFPAYNEAQNIVGVLTAFSSCLRELPHELIVVNDGSSDDTVTVLSALDLPNLRCVHHSTNKGYGAALRSGFSHAIGDWTFFTDADGQFSPEDFWKLWQRREDADLVLGVRAQRRDPGFRRLNAWIWRKYIAQLLNVKVQDLNCAFKLLPTHLLQQFPLESEGAFINAEMLAHFNQHRCTWLEVPVLHYSRAQGSQTGANPRVVLKALKESLRIRRSLQKHF